MLEKIMRLIDEGDFVAVFEMLDTAGFRHPTYAALKKEYVSGRYGHDWADRFKVFVRSQNFPSSNRNAIPPDSGNTPGDDSPVTPSVFTGRAKPTTATTTSATAGFVAYAIPNCMQIGETTLCAIRIGEDRSVLLQDMDVEANPEVRHIAISKKMRVVLVSPDPEAFEVRLSGSEVRQISSAAYAQWNFYVKPLKLGKAYLELQVFIVKGESSDGEQITSFSERVTIQAEEPTTEPAPAFKVQTLDTGRRSTESATSAKKILFLAANPKGTTPLQLAEEQKAVVQEMRAGRERERYQWLLPVVAADLPELLRALGEKPQLVHFSGHAGLDGIYLQNSQGLSQTIPLPALKTIFAPLRDHCECLLLNACYSAEQAPELSRLGFLVVGYRLPVGDLSAIFFARGFYLGLSEGYDYLEACSKGKLMAMMETGTDPEVQAWKNGMRLEIV